MERFSRDPDAASVFGPVADRRAAVEREQQERAIERAQRLASQLSPLNAPDERIRIWERLHGLNLPKAATHKLVRVIAEQTNLTVGEVKEEQQRRATSSAGVPGVSA